MSESPETAAARWLRDVADRAMGGRATVAEVTEAFEHFRTVATPTDSQPAPRAPFTAKQRSCIAAIVDRAGRELPALDRDRLARMLRRAQPPFEILDALLHADTHDFAERVPIYYGGNTP